MKFEIILADPPWSYSKYSNSKKNISSKVRVTPYPPMPLEDIKKIPVADIAEDNSVLLMWVTFPCLEMGLEVIRAWGFTFKTVAFNWLKKNKKGLGWFMGFGHYTRANGEICLLATRGKPIKVIKKNMSQVVVTPITKHSEKPKIVLEKIVNLFGDLPRVELFARSTAPGWICIGDKIDGSDITESIKKISNGTYQAEPQLEEPMERFF